MSRFIYGLGLAFRGLMDIWDETANMLLLGYNNVPLEDLQAAFEEYEDYPPEED